MAVNEILIRRPSDRNMMLAMAVIFPLAVLVGYSKTYYFKAFFEVPAMANNLVHLHAIVMTTWVIYFVVQVGLVRTKNLKLHMTMGMAGIALALLVITIGLATAYDSQLVRHSAPTGTVPYEFFIVPATDMLMFAVLFAAAIYYRKKPSQHKSLMLLTAINFLPPALARMPVVAPEHAITFAAIVCIGIGLGFLIWHSWKHRKFNVVFAAGFVMLIVSLPIRTAVSKTDTWYQFTQWLAT